jgi:hypothetical protein
LANKNLPLLLALANRRVVDAAHDALPGEYRHVDHGW